jgi:hypothetical protein
MLDAGCWMLDAGPTAKDEKDMLALGLTRAASSPPLIIQHP